MTSIRVILSLFLVACTPGPALAAEADGLPCQGHPGVLERVVLDTDPILRDTMCESPGQVVEWWAVMLWYRVREGDVTRVGVIWGVLIVESFRGGVRAWRGVGRVEVGYLHGGRLDRETGLYYFRNRYYDPERGRWISRDPKGLWGDPNQLGNGYGFVGANAINGLDPYGLQEGGGWVDGDGNLFMSKEDARRYLGDLNAAKHYDFNHGKKHQAGLWAEILRVRRLLYGSHGHWTAFRVGLDGGTRNVTEPLESDVEGVCHLVTNPIEGGKGIVIGTWEQGVFAAKEGWAFTRNPLGYSSHMCSGLGAMSADEYSKMFGRMGVTGLEVALGDAFVGRVSRSIKTRVKNPGSVKEKLSRTYSSYDEYWIESNPQAKVDSLLEKHNLGRHTAGKDVVYAGERSGVSGGVDPASPNSIKIYREGLSLGERHFVETFIEEAHHSKLLNIAPESGSYANRAWWRSVAENRARAYARRYADRIFGAGN